MSEVESYDVVVIGAGPGGYIAAIRAAQLGMKVACVDQFVGATGKPALGGTCLNVGCIPSKSLLDSSHLYTTLQQQGAEHGIQCKGLSVDVSAMQKRKDKIVLTFTRGIEALFKKNKVQSVHGTGSLKVMGGSLFVEVSGQESARSLSAQHIIIATGSRPAPLPGVAMDGMRVVDSTGALAFDQVPAKLGIVGAGVIGLELGSVWRRLGSDVIVLEALDQFLPAVDREIASEAAKLFKKQGLDIRLGSRVKKVQAGEQGVSVEYERAGVSEKLELDRLIVAIGRKPNTEHLNVEAAGLKLDARGYIEVDDHCRTAVSGIYAVGDVVRGPMLAHKASEEGVAVAELIAGQPGGVEYGHIPWVIYTSPEIAWVGETEESLKARGVEYRSGSFPFAAVARAKAQGETAGRIKILADAHTDRVLGVHCLGPQVSELIAEAVTVMAFEGSAEDIARTVHAHPTLSEAMHEAALGVAGRMLNG